MSALNMNAALLSRTPRRTAYLFVETGDGELYPALYWRPNGWLVCGYEGMSDVFTLSFVVGLETTLYLCRTAEEKAATLAVLRADLAARRARWAAC